ncbi:MAG: hypothetical protein ABSD45_22375 [Terriglobia bacterium]|jgi:glucose uptake protein
MFIPGVYAVALFMMVLGMICWGSWANTQKLCKDWRFELFYWDYIWGILLISLLMGFTLGRSDAASPDSFLINLRAADGRHLLLALLGGIVFNIANILLVRQSPSRAWPWRSLSASGWRWRSARC